MYYIYVLPFQMKYNEIEPGEYNDFTRKLEDGDLLSGLTHNLNLVDYGIPEVRHHSGLSG